MVVGDSEVGTEFVAVDIHAVVLPADITDSSWKLPARISEAKIPRNSTQHTIRCMIDSGSSSPTLQSK